MQVDLKDSMINEESKQQFRELCTQYKDMFSLESSNTGKTGLGTIDMYTGDSILNANCSQVIGLMIPCKELTQLFLTI